MFNSRLPGFSKRTLSLSVRLASTHHKIVIVGGGTGGINCSNQIYQTFQRESINNGTPELKRGDIALIDGSKLHHYQPAWSLVGAGLANKADMNRPLQAVVPEHTVHIGDHATAIDPENNSVTVGGDTITYEHLVVAAGIESHYDAVPGMAETLGQNNVCSIYDYENCDKVWEEIQGLSAGKTALFTQPKGAIKCAGAPQKIMWLAEDYWRKNGLRQEGKKGVKVEFNTPLPTMFAVPKYSAALDIQRRERDVVANFGSTLVEVDGPNKVAIFENNEGKRVEKKFDMLHVVPPMAPHSFIAKSKIADSAGFVDVDQATLQSKKYPNVWSLGDCSSLPTSKTAAAVMAQTPVLSSNLYRAVQKMDYPQAEYDGYTSCPLLVKYGKLILAEFKYGGIPAETFGNFYDQAMPSTFAFYLKSKFFPFVYFTSFLKGQWYGKDAFTRPKFAIASSQPK